MAALPLHDRKTAPRSVILACGLSASALAAALSPTAAQARAEGPKAGDTAENAAQAALFEQARFWIAEGRADLAIQSLNRILTNDPNNPEALFQVGRMHVLQGEAAAARTYAIRLQTVAGDEERAARLRKDIDAISLDDRLLDDARSFAARGDAANAVRVYETLFNGDEPPEILALEYYETLAGVERRWGEAFNAIAARSEADPADLDLALLEARILTYNAERRREGLARLSELSRSPRVGDDALDAMADALTWLDGRPSDDAVFAAYLQARPNDEAVREAHRLALNPDLADPRGAALRQGYAHLMRNELFGAEASFQAALDANASDADALAGMANLRVRQERYAEAEDFITRAMAIAPENAGEYAPVLDVVRFWSVVRDARASLERGQVDAARARMADARPRTRDQRVQHNLLAGEIAIATGDPRRAHVHFSAALELDPVNEQAFVQLAEVFLTAQDDVGLERLLSRVGRAVHASGAPSRAVAAKARGWLAQRRGDDATAARLYAEALVFTPDDAWTRLELARLYAYAGQSREADALFVDAAGRGDADFAHAAAIFASEQGRWGRAEGVLNAVPESERTPGMRALLDRARVRSRVDMILAGAPASDVDDVRRMLVDLYQPHLTEPDETQLIASALLKLGADSQAARLLRQASAARGADEVAPLIGAASMLVAAGDLSGAQALLDSLAARSERMSPADRVAVTQAYDTLLIGRARAALDAGDPRRALDFASAVYAATPSDPAALRTLGEINAALGRPNDALAFYAAALDQNTADVDALSGLVGAAAQLRRFDEARRRVENALAVTPYDPRVHLLAADVAEASGDLHAAIEATERARSLDRAAAVGSAPARLRTGDPDARPTNPFRIEFAAPVPAGGTEPLTSFGAPISSVPGPAGVLLDAPTFAVAPTAPAIIVPAATPRLKPIRRARPIAGPTAPTANVNATWSPAALQSRRPPAAATTIIAAATAPIAVVDTTGAPAGVRATVRLADALALEGDLAGAGAVIAEIPVDALTPHETAVLRAAAAGALPTLARRALDEGRIEDARTIILHALTIGVTDADALTNLGATANAAALTTEAASLFTAAAYQAPGDLDALIAAAVTLEDAGRSGEALALLNQAPAPVAANPAITALSARLTRRTLRMETPPSPPPAPGDTLIQAAAPVRAPRPVPITAPPLTPMSTPPLDAETAPPAAIDSRPFILDAPIETPDGAAVFAARTGAPLAHGAVILDDVAMGGEEPGVIFPAPPTQTGWRAPSAVPTPGLRALRDDPAVQVRLRSTRTAIEPQHFAALETDSRRVPDLRGDDSYDWRLASLNAQVEPSAQASFGVRWRDGEEGLSQVTEITAPVEFGFTPARKGRGTLVAEPVFLTAGRLEDDPATLARFGALATVAPEARAADSVEDAGGVALAARYALGGFGAEIGVTPLGFEATNLVGRIGFDAPVFTRYSVGLEASRQPVKDSVLSYAGAVDPVTGETFGAAVDNRLQLRLGREQSGSGAYLNAAFSVIDAENVDSNTGGQVDAGLYADFYSVDGHTLTGGFNLTYLGYEENRSGFTLGHGGYFSPQSFISATFPASYVYEDERLTVEATGAIGVQYFSEDEVGFFPDRQDLADLALQTQIDAASEGDLFYASESETALTARGAVQADYRLTPTVQAFGRVSIDRAADYTEAVGLVGLTLVFTDGR